MSQRKWIETASGYLNEDQRNAFEQARAALPAGFDRKAGLEKFQALNERIKAALPLDPASEQAQRFLDERDAMLQPFLALFSAEAKQAAKNLRENIKTGELSSPIDAEVDRFYQEAARARRARQSGEDRSRP